MGGAKYLKHNDITRQYYDVDYITPPPPPQKNERNGVMCLRESLQDG